MFERDEVLTAAGAPFSVFTPYKDSVAASSSTRMRWPSVPVARLAARAGAAAARHARRRASLQAIGFEPSDLHALRLDCGERGAQRMLGEFLDRIDDYAQARDFPAVKGPSYLGVHLRFGTLSVRQLAREAWQRTQGGSTARRRGCPS